MILLDTNIVSALMRDEPDRAIIGWLDSMPSGSIWISTITAFEIRFGIALLAESRRRRLLEEAFDMVMASDLEGRILPFDEGAADAAARLAARRRQQGKPIEIRDVQIAGIALARKTMLATRNVRHFEDTGVNLVNPWSVLP